MVGVRFTQEVDGGQLQGVVTDVALGCLEDLGSATHAVHCFKQSHSQVLSHIRCFTTISQSGPLTHSLLQTVAQSGPLTHSLLQTVTQSGLLTHSLLHNHPTVRSSNTFTASNSRTVRSSHTFAASNSHTVRSSHTVHCFSCSSLFKQSHMPK